MNIMTLYEKFIDVMERNGFRKIHSAVDENYAKVSDDDETISVSADDCHMITIKGIRESKRKNGEETPPHIISMKIYDNGGKELEPNDTIQFILVEFKIKGLPTDKSDKSRCIYYQYPYRSVPLGIKFKKGIAITKDKILEIRIMRNFDPVKIGKFEMNLECDKWFKIEEKRKGTEKCNEGDNV